MYVDENVFPKKIISGLESLYNPLIISIAALAPKYEPPIPQTTNTSHF